MGLVNEIFKIDLSDYEDTQSAHVPEGNYLVRITNVKGGKSDNGNAKIIVWLEIVGTEYEGLQFVQHMALTEKAMFRIVALLQAIGIKTPKKVLTVPASQMLGKTLIVHVEDGEPYRGVVKSEVRSFSRATSGSLPNGGTTASAQEDGLFDDEDEISEDPTDYDEDVETEKAKAAAAKARAVDKARAAKARAKAEAEKAAAEAAAAAELGEDDDDDDDDIDDLDLDAIDLDDVEV